MNLCLSVSNSERLFTFEKSKVAFWYTYNTLLYTKTFYFLFYYKNMFEVKQIKKIWLHYNEFQLKKLSAKDIKNKQKSTDFRTVLI